MIQVANMSDTLALAQQEGRAPWTDVEIDTRDFVVYKDKYPVTEGHILIVPRVNTHEAIMNVLTLVLLWDMIML